MVPETSQGPTDLRLQLTEGVFFPRIKRLERVVQHSFPSSNEAKDIWNYTAFKIQSATVAFSFTARDLGLKETSPVLNADGQMVGWLVLKIERT